MVDLEMLKSSLLAGDRIALAKAITLIESDHQKDRKKANELIAAILEHTGNSIRIGITGVPGVGKSTFIESIGSLITGEGKKLAVLAIDPSSPSSKGSILGDKTRMGQLSTNPNAFIRPSAAGRQLGGVANKTTEAILLCEAAGYDVIFIETVGVGQSEVAVKNMTDIFLLLMLAGAGDELQGIKRGIMEMADILVINKADSGNVKNANRARMAYQNALHLFSERDSGWSPPVLTCSSLNQMGIDTVWQELLKYAAHQKQNLQFESNREMQKKHWFSESLNNEIISRIKTHPDISKLHTMLESQVLKNLITPYQAATEILDKVLKK
jgi:LAO/AO transport system kinase